MLPSGFCRVITDKGTIIEGNFTPDGKKNGWCIIFAGQTNAIYMGWFKDDLITGNFMELRARDRYIVTSGWYQKNRRIGDLRWKD